MTIKLLLVLCVWCSFGYQGECAPQFNFAVVPGRNPLVYAYNPQPRPFFGSIGDWITNSNWFPIEINVPDTIANIASGISGITGTISNGISGIGGLAQRIPLINRLTSPERPRPLQYLILVPPHPEGVLQNRNDFNPFAPGAEAFPHYP